jgi:hypothetical protein
MSLYEVVQVVMCLLGYFKTNVEHHINLNSSNTVWIFSYNRSLN